MEALDDIFAHPKRRYDGVLVMRNKLTLNVWDEMQRVTAREHIDPYVTLTAQ